jgi:hypothetical protein
MKRRRLDTLAASTEREKREGRYHPPLPTIDHQHRLKFQHEHRLHFHHFISATLIGQSLLFHLTFFYLLISHHE